MVGKAIVNIRNLCMGALARMRANRGQKRMDLVETLNLGGKRQLFLVVCDGRNYLIGAGGDSVHSIEAIGALERSTIDETSVENISAVRDRTEILH